MDLRRVLLATTALTSFAVTVTDASASTASFTNTFGVTSAPGSIDGAFDISSFLEQEAQAGNAVTVNTATIQVYGYSSPTNTYTSAYAGSYVAGYATNYYPVYYAYYYDCGWSTCEGYGVYYQSYTYAVYGAAYDITQGDTQVDTVVADFGSQQQVSANDSHPNTTSYANNYYASYYTTTGNDYGNVSNSALLTSLSLNQLVNTSVLDYVLNVTQGDFSSLGIELDLNYSTSPDPTPLPPALPLFATGLGAVGLLGWRRRKKKPA